MLDILFFTDVLVTFNQAYLDDDYKVIDDRKQIARDYLKGWFIVDVLSCLPYGPIAEYIFDIHGKTKRYIFLVKLIKLMRILKLVKD